MSHQKLFEKFPPLLWHQKKVIWDTRQPHSNDAEFIIVDEQSSTDVKQQLSKRATDHPGSELMNCEGGTNHFLAQLAFQTWGSATGKLKIIGVTGTNGKSTCVALLRHMIKESQISVCEIGTLGIQIWRPGENLPSHQEESGFTTPLAHQLHYLFDLLVKQGVQTVVMETSSHALELGRVYGLKFSGTLFTNLTQDHLDFHKTMENYEAAKLKLFTDFMRDSNEAVSVINTQDKPGQRIFARLQNLQLGAVAFSRDQTYTITQNTTQGLEIKLATGERIRSPLVGEFNAENIVGSLEIVHRSLGIDRESLASHLQTFQGVMGRMERVTPVDYDFQVFVDYAHTPDALQKTLSTCVALKTPHSRLFCVFGCGGDRDPTKRPQMGEVAAQLADRIVVTSDNPRGENPEHIINDVLWNMNPDLVKKMERETDRKRAILQALGEMKKGDVLVVAGKGHEQYQICGSQTLPFSDQQVVRDFLKLS